MNLEVAVHYALGELPLCDAESWIAVSTDDPTLVPSCRDCLELVVEDKEDQHEHDNRRLIYTSTWNSHILGGSLLSFVTMMWTETFRSPM